MHCEENDGSAQRTLRVRKRRRKAPACTFVDVYAQSGDWYQVEYGGTMAWGSSSTLVFEDIPKAGPKRPIRIRYTARATPNGDFPAAWQKRPASYLLTPW
jgi:hypothetical protein